MRPVPTLSRTRIAALLIALPALACSEDSVPTRQCDPDSIQEIVFTPDVPIAMTRLHEGVLVRVHFRNECNQFLSLQTTDVEWRTSDPSVVAVFPLEDPPEPGPTVFVESAGFGSAEVSATYRNATGSFRVEVEKPQLDASGFEVIDAGEVGHSTTDLWVHGQYAYSGSQPWRCASCSEAWLYVWRLSGDGGLERVDSLSLPTRRINDVKVAADGSFAVATMEASETGENGIAILDLADPAAPSVITRYTEGLEHGVHNVWIERLGGTDYVFAVEDGGASEAAGVHVLDLSDLAAPTEVALFHAGSSFPHDVYVREGLAFVSHWDAGLIILDVGHGVMSGSPDDPVEVGRVVTEGGNVHNAWYWPERRLVFVGEERFPPPESIEEVGVLHVVDLSDLTNPVEVARFGVPGATPHNVWVDEENAVLFAAWYENGLRAIDVSGELSGDLAAQGLELGYVIPSGPRGAARVWAPQLHQGVIYLSDIQNGLWAVRFGG